jgi:hypothetical protein
VHILNEIAPSVFKLLVSLKNVSRIGVARWNKFMVALAKVFKAKFGEIAPMFPSSADADEHDSQVAKFGSHSVVIDLVDANGKVLSSSITRDARHALGSKFGEEPLFQLAMDEHNKAKAMAVPGQRQFRIRCFISIDAYEAYRARAFCHYLTNAIIILALGYGSTSWMNAVHLQVATGTDNRDNSPCM